MPLHNKLLTNIPCLMATLLSSNSRSMMVISLCQIGLFQIWSIRTMILSLLRSTKQLGKKVTSVIGQRPHPLNQSKFKKCRLISTQIPFGTFQMKILIISDSFWIMQSMSINSLSNIAIYPKTKIFLCKFKWISNGMGQKQQQILAKCLVSLSITAFTLIVSLDFNLSISHSHARSVNKMNYHHFLSCLIKFIFRS
jgi:hypothetical protein